MRPPAIPSRVTLLRAGDLDSLGEAARTLGLGAVLDRPLGELPRNPAGPGLDMFLDEHARRDKAATIERLLDDGPIATEARRRLPAKLRKRLVDRVRAYLLAATDAGLATAPARSADVGPGAHDVSGDDLTAWATQRGVLGLMRGRVGVLADAGDLPRELAGRARELGANTLEEALLAPRKAWPRGQAPRASQLGEAGRRFLLRASEDAQEAWAHAPIPALPSAPALRSLGERLLALRAQVLESNAPGPVPYVAQLELASTAITAHLTTGRGHGVRVRVSLTSPATAHCQCLGDAAACRHVLATIDGFLRSLENPRNHAFVREVELALRPPWERALATLGLLADQAAVGAAPTHGVAVTEWRLKRLKTGLKLAPYVQVGRRTRELRRYQMSGQAGRPHDRTVASLLDSYIPNEEQGERLSAALELLVGDPRLVLATGTRTRPLTVKRARAELVGVTEADGLRLSLALDGRPVADAELAVVPASGGALIVLRDDPGAPAAEVELAHVDHRLVAAWRAFGRVGGALPTEALGRLAELAPRLSQVLPIRLPESVLGPEIAPSPRLVLRLDLGPDDSLGVQALIRPVPEAPAFPPGAGPRDVFLTLAGRDGARGHVRRVLEDEPTWVSARLAALGLPLPAEPVDGHLWRLDGDPAIDLLAVLDDPAIHAELELEWPKGPARRVVTAGALKIEVRERRDWFGLSGGLDVDGAHVALADLLAALRAGRRYVRVAGDRWARLSDDLRARLAAVNDLTAASADGLELPAMAAPFLDDALGDALGDAPRRWRELIERARAATTAPPTPLPPLGVTLRDYQVAGFEWLSRLASWGAGACLADDMGLGKTIQALAVLTTRRALGPALVVAPTSVGWNWVREAERGAPDLRLTLFSQSERDTAIARARAGDVLVVSYGLLVRHAEAFAAQRFATIVFDEAHALKNPATRRAQAAALLSGDFKLALTGTPLENRLTDLWSLFRIIVPGLLGGLERFRERFATPIERDHDDARRAALARLVRPFLLRRLKREVARELPPRTDVQVDVTLGKAERDVYDAIRVQAAQALAGELGADKRFAVLAALTRLRQAACDTGLVDPSFTAPSSKLARLVELVDELRAEGHRALVFSQFTSLLRRAQAAVEASGATCLYLDGATPEGRRRELVDAFQAGRGDVFFISLKAGGAGLNLTGADNVIHLDPWWNPAVEDQATDRAHRIGQDRPVTAYRLVASDTVEDAILRLHADKRALVAGVLDGAHAAATLDPAALFALVAAGGDVTSEDDSGGDDGGVPDLEPIAPPPRVRPQPATVPRPSASPASPLLPAFRAHLADTGLAPSSVGAYASCVGRWLAARPVDEPPARTAVALRAALAADDGGLPGITRSALRRLAAFLAT